jgi:hypothetical protein
MRTPFVASSHGRWIALAGAALFFAAPARAGDPAAPAPAPAPAPASPVAGAPPAALTSAQLEDLVAPVALYPDVVLASVLPATTNAIQVVQAARYVEAQGGAVTSVPQDKGWDPAVQALVQYPDVLAWMNENLEWVEQVGYAVTTQQADVMKAVQSYRAKAKAAGHLASNAQQTVVVQETTQVIQVVPADPQVIYVPVYDPVVVVQAPPPSSAPPPGVTFAAGVAVGVLGAWAWHELAWDDDYHIHVHAEPYHWDADFERNVSNEINVNTGDINVGNDVRVGNGNGNGQVNGGNRWETTRPTTRPTTLPANANAPVARPRPSTTRPRTTAARGPVAAPSASSAARGAGRPGDIRAPDRPAPVAFDTSAGSGAFSDSQRGRGSLGAPPASAPARTSSPAPSPASRARGNAGGGGGAFGGVSGGARRDSSRGSRSLRDR